MNIFLILMLVFIFLLFSVIKLNNFVAEKARKDFERRVTQQARARREAQREFEEAMRIIHEYNQRTQKRTQQNYRQPPLGRTAARGTISIEGAKRLLASYGGYREAVKKTHPDLGGSAQEFRKVQAAKELLDKFGY